MFSQLLGKPIQIQGQDIILLPDIIGTVPVTEQHEYVEIAKASNTCAAIQIREGDVEFVRQLYPKLPVYGLWQVLVHSNLIDINTHLQVVPVNDMDGYYVHADVGRIIYSGNYDAGFFAADTDFRLSHAKVINPQLQDLKLPKKPALLAKEILGKRRHSFKKIAIKATAAITVVGAIAFGVDYSLQLVSEQKYTLVAEKDNELKILKQKYQQLAKNRLIKTPDQSQTIDRLAVVMHDLSDLEFQGSIVFKDRTVALSAASDENPSTYYHFVTSEIKPDGRWDIKLSLQ